MKKKKIVEYTWLITVYISIVMGINNNQILQLFEYHKINING